MDKRNEEELMSRAAWLYYLGGLNQEETSNRLGLTRARVNKLLLQARESGLVSITIDQRNVGLMAVERSLADAFGLDFCIATPELGLTVEEASASPSLARFPIRAVGSAGARHLRAMLAARPDAVVGVGWGRTLEQLTLHMAGTLAPAARFVSVMGSLTANSACNPFEVVQALSQKSGGSGYFMPVPFIADSAEDRSVLLSQRGLARPLDLASRADLTLISLGELTEGSLLRQQNMITAEELVSLRRAGAVGDTNGIFFDAAGKPVDHSLNERTLAVGFDELKRSNTVVLAAGREKTEAALALLRSGIARGLIVDGDTACEMAARLDRPAR